MTPILDRHFFRHETGRVVGALTRLLGSAQLELAEDSVQEAFVRALRAWPLHGIPADPSAWLFTVARRIALDELRRAGRRLPLEAVVEPPPQGGEPPGTMDDVLRLMFACCHPQVPVESAVVLTLRVVGGFGTDELARAFLVPNATLAQRIVRAKRRIAALGAPLELPSRGELAERVGTVLDALYLLFSEGYSPHDGDRALREDLVEEAIRLVRLLAQHPVTACPQADALAALFLLQASRTRARVSAEGELIPLAEQARSLWNSAQIDEGMERLARSARGDSVSPYHVLASIAACHALSPSYAETDWERIVGLYDDLRGLHDTPIVRLGRAVAVGMAVGPSVELDLLDRLAEDGSLDRHAPFHAARAGCLERLARRAEAGLAYDRAATLAGNEPERRAYQRQARQLSG